jgi:GAF domain-containing protein
VQEYVTQVERLPDGSLCTTLYGDGRRLHQEPVRNRRHGKRRAYDLLCTAVDNEWDVDPSIQPMFLGSNFPSAEVGSLPGARLLRAAESDTGVGSSAGDAAGALTARAAAEAMRSAAASPSAADSLRVVLEMALRSGPWDAGCISVHGRGAPMQPVACSDEWAADADRLQVGVGEGPCLDAVHPEPDGAPTEPMIAAADLSIGHAWPRWAPAATALGIRAVVALRLFTDHTVGSISLYARHPRGWDRRALEDAQVVAALASVVLAQVCTERNLRRAIDSRGLIGQAQGILMQRHGLTAESAFTELSRYSQQHNTKVIALAEQLTKTGELPNFG